MTPQYLERIVGLLNELRPDLVAITGDFVSSSSARYVLGLVGPLGRLDASDGVVGILGNHDYWAGEQAVGCAVSSAGVIHVSNGLKTVHRDGAPCTCVGSTAS